MWAVLDCSGATVAPWHGYQWAALATCTPRAWAGRQPSARLSPLGQPSATSATSDRLSSLTRTGTPEAGSYTPAARGNR